MDSCKTFLITCCVAEAKTLGLEEKSLGRWRGLFSWKAGKRSLRSFADTVQGLFGGGDIEGLQEPLGFEVLSADEDGGTKRKENNETRNEKRNEREKRNEKRNEKRKETRTNY